MSARLYLDEDISPEVAQLLRRLGLDVISAHESGNLRASDPDQLAYATAAGRVIVTCNCTDFLRLAREWSDGGKPHGGIILSYRQYPRREIGEMVRLIARFLAVVTPEELHDAVYVLDALRVG